MLSEYHIVFHVNDIHSIIRVILFQELQDLKLNSCLIVIFLLIFNNFQCNDLLPFMIEAFNRLSERTLPQKLLNFIPVSDLVSRNNFIVTLVIIVTTIMIRL